MYRNILIPLDGSERAEHVFRHLETFFDLADAQLTLLTVVQVPELARGDYNMRMATARAEAESYLKGVTRRLQEGGRRADIEVLSARRPEHGILALEESADFDLIAIASHGYGGLDRLYYGSTAERVIRAASTPVLLIRSSESHNAPAQEDDPIDFTTTPVGGIVVPLDGSKNAESALYEANRLAEHHGVAIHLLHVMPVVPRTGFFVADSFVAADTTTEMSNLRQIAADLRDRGREVQVALRHGAPVEAITDYVKEQDVGLIVMTTHGRSGLSRFLLGSVAEGLLRTVHTPILLRRVTS